MRRLCLLCYDLRLVEVLLVWIKDRGDVHIRATVVEPWDTLVKARLFIVGDLVLPRDLRLQRPCLIAHATACFLVFLLHRFQRAHILSGHVYIEFRCGLRLLCLRFLGRVLHFDLVGDKLPQTHHARLMDHFLL